MTLTFDQVEEIASKNQDFLNRLESLAISALATGEWDDLHNFLNEAGGVTSPRLRQASLQEFLGTQSDQHLPDLVKVERAIAHLRLNPQPQNKRLEELRQQYETVLCLLESDFLGALVSSDWSEFDEFVSSFRSDD
jgi:hypothetical protein